MKNSELNDCLPFNRKRKPDESGSLESEQLLEHFEQLKKGLTLIREKLSKALEFGGAQAVKDFLNCSEEDIANVQQALGQEFFFPILCLRKTQITDNAVIPRSITSLVSDIKRDLLAIAVKTYEIDPMLVPLFVGISSEECEKMLNLYPSEFEAFVNNSDWVPTVHPLVKLVELDKDKTKFFTYLYNLISLRSKSEIAPMEMPSISNHQIALNAKNANVNRPDLNSYKLDSLNDAAFLLDQGLERPIVSLATNIWKIRVREDGEETLPKRRDTKVLQYKDLTSEAPYRIYIALYNYLTSNEDNAPLRFRQTAVAFRVINKLFEVSDCWKKQEVVSITYTFSYTAALYQTFNWIYGKSYLNVYDRCSVNDLSFKKFMRLRPGPFHASLTEIVHCKKCGNNFLAANVLGLKKVCPICDSKLTI